MDKKKSVLFKNLDIVFVYLFVFLVGIAIVLGMASYLNNKVREFSDNSIAYSIKG